MRNVYCMNPSLLAFIIVAYFICLPEQLLVHLCVVDQPPNEDNDTDDDDQVVQKLASDKIKS